MSAESQLYALLSADAGVTALISTRIYPDLVPELKTPPYIGYERVGTEPIVAISGAALGQIANMTLACWSATRVEAEAVADAVVAALAGSNFIHLTRGAEVDEATGRLAATLDYQILTT